MYCASCVRGYHDIWTAAIGEELDCEGIRKSVRYIWHAVAVKRAGVTVGHIIIVNGRKRDIGLADTMAKKSTEQERGEYSNAHLQSLCCVAY